MDPATAQMVKVLMSWTVHLATAYSLPEQLPELVYEPQQYFVDNVCGGVKKNAMP